MAQPQKKAISAEMRSQAENAISTVAKQVKFTIAEYPVSLYVSRFADDETDRYFVPSYQRDLVWKPEQQAEFVESLIVGLPVPFMFFYQTPGGRMEIVDGSQRMRAMRAFIKENLRLKELTLVPELNGFCFFDLPEERRNKLEDVTIRTIVLDTDTDPSTRAEMFSRINRTGTSANEAEIRRGSLPGPVTDLVKALAEEKLFVGISPLTDKAIKQREREELITRFFAYTNSYKTPEGRFPGYRDRPKKFLYDYLKKANAEASHDPKIVLALRLEFENVVRFVQQAFPLGFRKTETARTIPRVRFEAIAVGTALALRENPALEVDPREIAQKMQNADFDSVVVSDGANVRSKLEGRIDLVQSVLLSK